MYDATNGNYRFNEAAWFGTASECSASRCFLDSMVAHQAAQNLPKGIHFTQTITKYGNTLNPQGYQGHPDWSVQPPPPPVFHCVTLWCWAASR